MTNERVFGVDGNWYLHRVIHTQMFEPEDEADSQARRLMGMVCKDAIAVQAKRVAIAFDADKVFRYKLYPDYKSGRNGKGKAEKEGPTANPYLHLPYIMDYFTDRGIHVVQTRKHEADDVLCTWAHIHSNFVGGTQDKDGYQWVMDGKFMYDSSRKPEPVRIRSAEVLAHFGIPPAACIDYQTLVGDQIDSIPQLMRKDEVLAGLKRHGSIQAWAKADPKFLKFCRKHVDALNLNRRLVRLIPNIEGIGEVPPIKWSSKKTTAAYDELRRVAGSKVKSLF